MKMLRPSHPGAFVRLEILAPRELTVTKAADVLGVSRPALSAVLNGRASLSPEMALRIEKAFGVSMDTLVRMQAAWDAAAVRARERSIRVKRYAG
jgi:addiction module HigA family antidote